MTIDEVKELLILITEECNGDKTMIMRVLDNFYSDSNSAESEGMLGVLREARLNKRVSSSCDIG